MNKFLIWVMRSLRSLLADVFTQVMALLMFVFSGLAWFYFSSVFAGIAVFVAMFFFGLYIFKKIEVDGK